ncbi:hypothetical protein KM176_09770 [Pseudooceanicola sp. CBS1P-1]|uniref:Dihydrodipicolinate reductase n=1 Tax=Pseudooceanicola albus TaxID=2692189 RepID=A0A6L7G6P1_9RHOB|nr:MULTISPECIES: hypothetical protein [Pseudooceanicola]MBT9384146.1 hypothetical protein [Pseudooceanicola endophyticus]MXN19755.1 hypothetical protein [Pseudooceanicola albus]
MLSRPSARPLPVTFLIGTMLFSVLCAAPLAAKGFRQIETRSDFLALVDGHVLWSLGLSMRLHANGNLRGKSLGRRVTGRWHWKDGLFCRTMSAGDDTLPMNCQSVKTLANTLRFTADAGKGRKRDFEIR